MFRGPSTECVRHDVSVHTEPGSGKAFDVRKISFFPRPIVVFWRMRGYSSPSAARLVLAYLRSSFPSGGAQTILEI